MAVKHANLSASSSVRWINCPPSAQLNASVDDIPTSYAMQGTDAHSLCEYKVKKLLGMEVENPTENLLYYDEEMEICADDYANYVIGEVEQANQMCNDPLVLIEQRLDFSQYVPDGFGTADCVIVEDRRITVIDFKYGLGVIVSAEKNTQMMLYALGALILFDGIYDIDEISMTIFQPRRRNVSTYTIAKTELLEWAENILRPIAELAANGEGEFKAGNHCRFCKVKATCRKRAEYNLELAKYDFEMPNKLQDAEIEGILDKADELIAWVNDVKEYALEQALLGKQWHSYKVVEGRSVRKYTNEDVVAEKVLQAGYEPYEHKILSISSMIKLLGKKKFDELLGDCIVKPKGNPTLVSVSDKRHAINSIQKDFNDK